MSGGLAACGDDDRPVDEEAQVEECPAESPVRCGDESCAADAEACPGEEPDEPDVPATEIAGEIVGMSPRTILAHAPEPVRLMLSVDDAERVQKLVDAGASWRVRLESGSADAELIDAIASAAPPHRERAGRAAHDFVVEFTPSEDVGPQRVALSVELVVDEEAEVHAWGKVGLSYRGDASTLEFEGRESYPLESVSAADRVWGDDLDGDGIGDLVVSDVQVDATGASKSTLRVFKCDVDRCEPAGAVETAAASGAQMVTPDMVVAPEAIDADEPQGFLAATVAARSAAGDISKVEVIWIELVEDSGAPTLREHRATIDLARAGGGGRLHEQTLEPRLLLDQESNSYRPGLVVTRAAVLEGAMRWSTLVLDANGVLADLREHRGFEGLDEAQRTAALEGQLASCMSGASKGLLPHEAPAGMIVSAFELDGVPSLAVASIDQIGGPAQIFSLANHFDGEQLGPYGSVKCDLGDLDGDGLDDLVVSVGGADTYSRLGASSGQPASLLVATGIEKADIRRGMSAFTKVIDGVDAESQGFMRAGERLSLHITDAAEASSGSSSISKRSARTGRNVELGMTHDGEGGVSLSVVEVSLSPPGIPILSHDRVDVLDALASRKQGNDRVVRKKPGRTTYANITLERPQNGSTQLTAEEGSWVLAKFGSSITEGDAGDALLKSSDPETILGWLSSTGPFLPVEPSNGQEEIFISELSEIVYAPSVDGGNDRTTPLLYQGLEEKQGIPTVVTVHELALREGHVVLENERTIDLDTSGLNLEGKKAVKFKAGAELSKAVNAAAPDGSGDCDDAGSCPHPGEVLLAFELDSGEVLTAVHDYHGDDATAPEARLVGTSELHAGLGLDATSDLSGLSTSLRIGHDGHEPVVILHGLNVLGDDRAEVDESFVTIDRRGEVVTRESPRESSAQRPSLFGDVLGEGSEQLVVCKSADGATRCRVERVHDPVDSVEAVDDWADAVSIGDVGDDEEIIVVDVDGDRCADLVTAAGQVFSSRCDGSFEAAPVQLRSWAAHLSGGSRAQDYNAARSNKPTSIAWDDAVDDGDEDEIALPFFDGLELPGWE